MMRKNRVIPALVLAVVANIACATTREEVPAGPPPTFTRDIAPIVFQNCSVCHRPDRAAPFSLLGYGDVRRHAEQILEVTGSGFMPPWLPATGGAALEGERRLTYEEKELIRRWVEGGALQGDPTDLPPRPRFAAGWHLGEPDMVLELEEAYFLPASGRDVIRNFVIPFPESAPHFVAAVEIRPGNPKVIHHAVLQVDRTRSSRRMDLQSDGAGFDGMTMGLSEPPPGHFIGWTPGKVPALPLDGITWRLDPGSDIILQLHMIPSGKSETVAPKIGLYFGDPPVRHPSLVFLEETDIDIRAGEQDYRVRDEMTLPVAVKALGIYPHAHYLGKEIAVTAYLPDGRQLRLLSIPRWDFNWQDDYRFRDEIELPAGTRIEMAYSFDNSAANDLNPNNPPVRVRFGDQSSDEMANVSLQVLTADAAARVTLEIAQLEHAIKRKPSFWQAYTNMGSLLAGQGRIPEAVVRYQKALELEPDSAETHSNLARLYLGTGRIDEAAPHLESAIGIDPELALPYSLLGQIRASQGRLKEARGYFGQALELEPQAADTRFNLALIQEMTGQLQAAVRNYRRALQVRPDDLKIINNLGSILVSEGQFEEAEVLIRRALAEDPNSVEALFNQGRILATTGRAPEAIQHFEKAIRLRPDLADLHHALGLALANAGRVAEARAAFLQALELDPDHQGARRSLGRPVN